MWSSATALAVLLTVSGATASGHDADHRQSGGSRLRQTQDSPLPYRNAQLSVNARVDDLLSRMTLEEKAGQLFHLGISMGGNGTLSVDSSSGNGTDKMVGKQHITHFNLLGTVDDVRMTAEWHNRLQQRALDTRLGIPITLSTDPRHAFTENIGTGFSASKFSQWPESLGLAALRDPKLVETFANIARQEYLAVGMRMALHPQIDLSTEYRWARIGNTMGEDANLTSELVVSYLKGFQGEDFGKDSVATVTKHFPGAGPMENGEDSHFVYGKNQTYPGDNFEHHLIPFKAAIAAGARWIMPYYSRPIGTQYEEVGFSFNKGIVTDLLKGELGYEGIVISDWGLITDTTIQGQDMPARAWGVECLSELERTKRILDAGVDQFGGECRPELLVELVQTGVLAEERLDVSVRKLLKEKFLLGLFDNPFVDVDASESIVGKAEWVELGAKAQRDAYTLLTNKDNILPLKIAEDAKLYIEGFNSTYLDGRGVQLVSTPEEGDIALLRLQAPYEPRSGGFEANYHAGSLSFNASEQARQKAIYDAVPTIVDIYLDRPAAIPEIAEGAAALLGNFGSSPEAFLDVIFGTDGSQPLGRLPFDLPQSTEAVEESKEDVPFDTANPVFRFGDGLRYEMSGKKN